MNVFRTVSCLLVFIVSVSVQAAEEVAFPLKAQKILFLGDSITNAGGYIDQLEAQLRVQGLDPMPEILNLGLSSETCCGLSEPDHPFPRPNVQERLERALETIKPDVVVACYGMNDGIYYPFSEERFQKYQAGVQELIEKVHRAGAKVVLMTPPPFDSLPVKEKTRPAGAEEYAYYAPFVNYDEVLTRYGKWIMQDLKGAEQVIDLHTPLTSYTKQQRKSDPAFTMAPDGVHCNAIGHEMIADAILNAWGVQSREPLSKELLDLVRQKNRVLHDAYLSHVGHKRPGGKPGLPVEEAEAKAKELNAKIDSLVFKLRNPETTQQRSNNGTRYQIHYPASLSEDALKLYVDYYLWIPEDAKTIHGVIVHQHGCGVGASEGGRTAADDLHWQALAKKWNCALLGSCYEPREGVNCRSWCDPRNGSGQQFLKALTDFSISTQHAEIATAPWCLWGHSGGGFWASLMQTKHPERIVAVWFRSGTAFGYWSKGDIEKPELLTGIYRVPMMGNPGAKEKDHERFKSAWNGLKAMQAAYQEAGADFFEFAADPNSGHDCGGSRYLSIPFFDFWLEHRLPQETGGKLRSAKAALADWQNEMQSKMEEYRKTAAVSDTTPPPVPANVQLKSNDDQTITLTWTAEADLESGIKGFVITRDGEVVATLPEKTTARFSRPLFQGQSYHDTPEAPIPAMTWTDEQGNQKSKYTVQTVNSVDLRSEPTAAK